MLYGAGSGALLLVSLGCWVAYFADGTWADAAGWVEALATVAAFSAAIIAAVLVGRTLDLELDREEQRLEADMRSQAALVAAWPKAPTGEFDPVLDDDGFEVSELYWIEGAHVSLRNASEVPVTDVRVDVMVTVLDPADGREVGYVHATRREAYLPPGSSPVQWTLLGPGLRVPGGLRARPGEMHSSLPIRVDFYFTDAAGLRWHRSRRGLKPIQREEVGRTL